MALAQKNDNQSTWWLNNRNYQTNGLVYNGLVSDLAAGDYLVGVRAKVFATGATTSGNRALTLERNGVQFAVSWPATSTVQLIR